MPFKIFHFVNQPVAVKLKNNRKKVLPVMEKVVFLQPAREGKRGRKEGRGFCGNDL